MDSYRFVPILLMCLVALVTLPLKFIGQMEQAATPCSILLLQIHYDAVDRLMELSYFSVFMT
jgi:hypothetical protein